MWEDIMCLERENKLQALYPSVKIYIAFVVSICSIVLQTVSINGYPLLQMAWFVIPLILAFISGVFKKFLHGMSFLFFLAAFMLAVQAFLVPSGEIMWKFFCFRLSSGGLETGITLSFTILNIGGSLVWFFKTTTNKEIASAMNNAGVNPKAAYVFLSCFQMIDVLGNSSRTIMNAQRARGVETEGNILIRARAFLPSLVPMILSAITGAEERVITLGAKGFEAKGKRTQLFQVQRSKFDKTAVIIASLVMIVIIVWRVVLWRR